MSKIKILLVNPYVTDFALYDLWLRPLGLLTIASYLEKSGVELYFIDLLSREISGKKDKYFTTGKYDKEEIDLPEVLKKITDRKFFRYGISLERFYEFLDEIGDVDFIFLTSTMTYWCHGLFYTTKILKDRFPGAKVVLGGIYAYLCSEHAEKSGLFDYIITKKVPSEVLKEISEILGIEVRSDPPLPPAYFLYKRPLKHFALTSSYGCPFRCSYCASPIMYKNFIQVDPHLFLDIFDRAREFAKTDEFAFYDDALLVKRDRHIKFILKELIRKYGGKLNIHLPNAIHPRFLDEELVHLFKESGVRTIRLGFEGISENLRKKSSNKVYIDEIERGINLLKDVGYTHENIGAYIMFGVPGTSVSDSVESARFINSLGVKIFISNYSPIPYTRDFYEYAKLYPEIKEEPLLQNNTLTMIRNESDYKKLKKVVMDLNAKLK